ncbi:MAG: hypothetical protein ACUVS4_15505 [Chloroflexaceae bacterium]
MLVAGDNGVVASGEPAEAAAEPAQVTGRAAGVGGVGALGHHQVALARVDRGRLRRDGREGARMLHSGAVGLRREAGSRRISGGGRAGPRGLAPAYQRPAVQRQPVGEWRPLRYAHTGDQRRLTNCQVLTERVECATPDAEVDQRSGQAAQQRTAEGREQRRQSAGEGYRQGEGHHPVVYAWRHGKTLARITGHQDTNEGRQQHSAQQRANHQAEAHTVPRAQIAVLLELDAIACRPGNDCD